MAGCLWDASLLPVHINTSYKGWPGLGPLCVPQIRNMGRFELCRASLNPTATFNPFLSQYINNIEMC